MLIIQQEFLCESIITAHMQFEHISGIITGKYWKKKTGKLHKIGYDGHQIGRPKLGDLFGQSGGPKYLGDLKISNTGGFLNPYIAFIKQFEF